MAFRRADDRPWWIASLVGVAVLVASFALHALHVIGEHVTMAGIGTGAALLSPKQARDFYRWRRSQTGEHRTP